MARWLVILALIPALAACRSRAVGGDPTLDAGVQSDAAVSGDSAVVPRDAEVPCEIEEAWEWTHPDVEAITVDPSVSVEGETVRIFVSVLYDGCDQFYSVSASVNSDTREIKVWPYLLKRPLGEGCVGELAYGEDILVYGALAPGSWTVIALFGGAGPVSFDVVPCLPGDDCLCTRSTPNLPYGSECTYQCECEPGSVCVRFLGIGGQEHRQCFPSCSDDAQCGPGYACTSYDDGPSGVCQPMFTGPVPILCQGDAECEPSEMCHTWPDGARSCEIDPGFGGFGVDSQRCDCTDQCGQMACIAATGEDMWWNECHRPCRGERDCPPELWDCGARSQYAEPVCYFHGD